MADEEGVLRRWHRLKTEARDVPPDRPDPVEAPADHPVATQDAEAPEENSPALPDVDSLDGDSDFSAFMADGVPDELRNLALRKLWRLDPMLANLDGLVDYGEDFTDSATVIEGMKTIYRVGKGMFSEDDDQEPTEGAETTDPPAEVAEAAEGAVDDGEVDPEDDSSGGLKPS